MATDYRSGERAGSFTFRMTAAEKAQLEREAREGGFVSVQQLLEARVFGAPKPRRRPGPGTSSRQQEALLESA